MCGLNFLEADFGPASKFAITCCIRCAVTKVEATIAPLSISKHKPTSRYLPALAKNARTGHLEPNFRPPFERISDLQSPLTRLKKME